MISISLLINANQHGKLKEDNHNFWVSLLSAVIMIGLILWALNFNN